MNKRLFSIGFVVAAIFIVLVVLLVSCSQTQTTTSTQVSTSSASTHASTPLLQQHLNRPLHLSLHRLQSPPKFLMSCMLPHTPVTIPQISRFIRLTTSITGMYNNFGCALKIRITCQMSMCMCLMSLD